MESDKGVSRDYREEGCLSLHVRMLITSSTEKVAEPTGMISLQWRYSILPRFDSHPERLLRYDASETTRDIFSLPSASFIHIGPS